MIQKLKAIWKALLPVPDNAPALWMRDLEAISRAYQMPSIPAEPPVTKPVFVTQLN